MFKKKMFSAALACGLCVALSMPAYGAEVRGDITSDIVGSLYVRVGFL